MPRTLTEKIIAAHTGDEVSPGAMVELAIDLRVARDFGGANVVANLETNGLGIADPERTVFTFDCNPTGSDQGYAANQQRCRTFAREHGIRVFDIDRGIGTHLVIEEGLVGPGDTFVSTDSHANIMGAVGAFGQGERIRGPGLGQHRLGQHEPALGLVRGGCLPRRGGGIGRQRGLEHHGVGPGELRADQQGCQAHGCKRCAGNHRSTSGESRCCGYPAR